MLKQGVTQNRDVPTSFCVDPLFEYIDHAIVDFFIAKSDSLHPFDFVRNPFTCYQLVLCIHMGSTHLGIIFFEYIII